MDATMLNGFVSGAADLPPGETQLINRRQSALGPAYRLFYQTPVHLVRGEDVWVYGADGTRYLDAYNNVASVGHCHPHVVNAIAAQSSQLCTNTRYLTEPVIDYAERLLGTMPPEIAHVMFTCSGSEANDLALRIASDFTNSDGVIVTENAYHGTTHLISALSPALGRGVELRRSARTIPAPIHGDGERFAADVAWAIDDLARAGIRPCALLVDSLFTSDGVAANPAGFLAPAVRRIRDAGGLFIADEVQAGFGRTGAGMWCFARHGVIPDLVTLGKPMGNGYPVAAVATQRSVVAAFGAKARYFNTFGGNTVAVAAASAVLDVLGKQDLIQNAANVGKVFASELRNTRGLGPVRATGLMLGVDMMTDGAAPDPERALRIVNRMRHLGVLISASGKIGHTLKIRPPLTFGFDHLDLFMTRLHEAIRKEPMNG
jgi:4-aminobutyrate aminotransferase-like enzyme